MNIFAVSSSFLGCLLLFLIVGLASATRRKETTEDYLLAGRQVGPWLTALSSVSTNHSGFMFIGLIGYTYRQGFQAIWLMLGWFVGDFISWLVVHPKVRQVSEHLGVLSFPALLGSRGKGLKKDRWIVAASALLAFFFLGGYAAAQLKAGSTALTSMFGWPSWWGVVLGTLIVVAYSFAGGLRASIWTDATQAVVMVVSMALLASSCIYFVGGTDALFLKLHEIDSELVQWRPSDLAFGFALYLTGFLFGGFGVVGQPHIMVRFMAVDQMKSLRIARRVYFSWYALFSAAAVCVGLCSRILVPDLIAGVEPSRLVATSETALPAVAIAIMPDIFVGLILAGIFAATMSTADSQILSCSAAVTQDFFERLKNSYFASKLATVVVAMVACLIAVTANQGVFDLVLVAWAVLGASLGPLLIIRVWGAPLSAPIALLMMVSGIATVLLWGRSEFADDVYKFLPGFVVPALIYFFWLGSRAMRRV